MKLYAQDVLAMAVTVTIVGLILFFVITEDEEGKGLQHPHYGSKVHPSTADRPQSLPKGFKHETNQNFIPCCDAYP